MKVYIKSCHASLEYDQALMFRRMGHEVIGSFDVGSDQRPKLNCTKVSVEVEDGLDSDIFILHQCDGFPLVFHKLCEVRKNKPVILNAFGQGSEEQHGYVSQVCQTTENAYVVAYSWTDFNRYVRLGLPEKKLRMIHFGKPLEDFEGYKWTGKLPIVYMSCNSIVKRGGGCQLELAKALMDLDFPLMITGKETNLVTNGIDALTYEGMRNMYRMARCYLSLGTEPAPLTLTLIEAMASGCPVISYDNGCGIRDERLPVLLADDVQTILGYVDMLLRNKAKAQNLSAVVWKCAQEEFNMKKTAKQWAELFEEIM